MRAIIIANGPAPKRPVLFRLQEGDWIISADGGAATALRWGWMPHTVIGDLDSLPQEVRPRLEAAGCQFVTFPERKDWTDLELALRHAVEGGATEIVILGARGGRLDQTLANLLLLSRPEWAEVDIRVLDGQQEAFVIRHQGTISGQVGDTVSLIALTPQVTGITTSGLEWPLRDGTLTFGSTLGISNVLTEPVAQVRVRDGVLLVVHRRQEAGGKMQEARGKRQDARGKKQEANTQHASRNRLTCEIGRGNIMRKVSFLLSLFMLALLVACTPPTPIRVAPTPTGPRTLTLMSHDSFSASEEVIAQFQEQYNVEVKFLKAGDAGSALNQAILSKENPLADVFFGVDNTFFSRALEADIFEPYDSPALADIPDELELDPQHRLLPVDFGDVCLNYDKAWFEEKGIAPPATLEDLVKPEYKGLTVVENPATSSPGLSFLIATVGHFGEMGDYTYLDFWKEMRANDVLVTDGWEEAYWGQFSAASEGTRPIVVSYATSPAAEVFFSEGKYTEPPTGNVLGEGACFRQIEFVGILKGTKNRDLAEKFVDFMLSKTFQEDIPLQMWVFPANEHAALPDVFQWAEVPPKPAQVSAAEIAAKRDLWIERWTEVVLR